MPSWGDLLDEIQVSGPHPLDAARRKYLRLMHEYTGRNIIAYYSGFLQKGQDGTSIDDNDKNALMQVVHKLPKNEGLDLLLHTPGGNLAATESLVYYLKTVFNNDIRAFVPQISMSGGTMIAIACKEIVMGKQSNIGPIDPQYGGMSCSGIIDEFKQAAQDIASDKAYIPLWGAIIAKYHPTFIGDCQHAVDMAKDIARNWLLDNMLSGEANRVAIADNIIANLGSHSATKTHSRHIHIDECEKMGLKVARLEELGPKEAREECDDLQDCVLTIHHAYMHTFTNSTAVKIIENHTGKAMIRNRNVSPETRK